MAFDPELLTAEESSGFDPSLLTPEDEEPSAQEILSRPAIPAWGAPVPPPASAFDPRQMAITSRNNPMPGYLPNDPLGEDLRNTVENRVVSEPSAGALKAGRYLNERTLNPSPLNDYRAPGFLETVLTSPGNQNLVPVPPGPPGFVQYADTLREAAKTYTPELRTAQNAVDVLKAVGSTIGRHRGLRETLYDTGTETGEPVMDNRSLQEKLAEPDQPIGNEAKIIRGVIKGGFGQVEGILQPENLPLLFAGGLPGVGGKIATAAFMADMAYHAPQLYRDVTAALKSGDTEAEAEALTNAIAAGTFFTMLGLHLTSKTAREGANEFLAKYTPEERAAYYQRLRVEAPRQLRESPLPERTPNASQVSQAAAIHGDVRPLAGEGEGQVPVEEGGTGVQPQAEGGLQENAPSEVQRDVELTPTVKAGGELWMGASHAEAKAKATAAKHQAAMMDIALGQAEHGFTDQNGKFYTRKEAAEVFKEQGGDVSKLIKPEEGLHSEDLRDAGMLKHLEAPKGEASHQIAPGVMIDPFLYHTAIKRVAKLAIQGAKAAYSNKHVQTQVQAANRTRQAFSTLFRSFENRNIMDQTMDAADNKAFTTGQQVRKGLEIGHDKADQNAASAIIAAGFDKAKLPGLLTKAQAGKNAEAIKAVQDAMAQYGRLEQLAKRGQADFDGQIQEENWHGINTEYHEDYLPGIYDQDLWMGGKRPFIVSGGGSGVSTSFKKGKTFDTPFDAIEAGYTPKSIALSELAEHRVRSGQRLINRKRWADGLRTEFDPTDGKPIVADVIRKPRGPGQPWYEVAPPGYRVQEIIPGHRIAVHEVYTPLFKALTGESAISSTEIGKLALETEGALKHGLLAFDTYHMSRIAQKSLILTGKLPSKRGRSLLEYADKDLSRAVTEGLITPEIEAWVRANRPVAQLGLDNGLNVGRVQEALYTSFVREFPGLKQTVGKFNKWVFEDVTRSALMEGFIHEFNRVSRIKPEVPRGTIAREVARDLNTYFGNLGRQGVFKSKTAQDMARLIALAPQWFESMGRTEAKGFLQLAKGVTYDPVVHKSVAVGSLGKAMGTGLLAYFAGMQVLNLITRRQPTWKNDEEGHKLDAWIPSADGKGNGFWLSPFAIPAEITHDMIRYMKKDGTSLKAAAHILTNKASPPARAIGALATGKSFWGDPKADNTWDRVKKAAWAVNPTPIPIQPLEHKTFPGQLQRQVTASLGGVKTEPAESPVQQVLAKAKSFMEKQGKKPMEFEMTDDPSYFKLRSALRADNTAEAQKVMNDLLKNHTRQQIFNAMERNVSHPFTGSVAQESKFKRTLTDKERQLYQKALNDRRDEFRKFKQFRSGLGSGTAARATGFDPSLLTPE